MSASSTSSAAAVGPKIDPSYEVFVDAISGATGALIGTLLLYPFENARTRLQAAIREKQN